MRAAEGLYGGAGAGLGVVHESLNPLDGELLDTANKQQEEIAATALTLVADELARRAMSLADKSRQGSSPEDVLEGTGNLPTEVSRGLLRLFDRSPLGVLLSLEAEATEDYGAEEYRLRAFVKEQLALALPPEFQHFRHQTRLQRAEQMA